VERRHHLVIAGTGRAGTTFLVRFLAECGVPAGDLADRPYSEEGRAGLEQHLFRAGDAYLVKDAWFFEYVDQIDLATIAIDALILPVRNIRHAAMSRVRQERAALTQSGWPSSWSTRPGATAGGVFSMSVQEQERVLALGFVKQVEWCVTNDVPLILLQFPRLVADADYLIDALWPILERFCTRQVARQVFDAWADPQSWLLEDLEDTDLDLELAEQLIKTEAALLAADRLLAEVAELRVRERDLVLDRDAAVAKGRALEGELADRVAEAERLNADLTALQEQYDTRVVGDALMRETAAQLQALLDDAHKRIDAFERSRSVSVALRLRRMMARPTSARSRR